MALDIRIAGRYKLGRKIGSGSFGDIYLGKQNPIFLEFRPKQGCPEFIAHSARDWI